MKKPEKKDKIRYDEKDSRMCSYYCLYLKKEGSRCKKFKKKLSSIGYMTSPYSGGRDYYRCSRCRKLTGEPW